jgi:hypothetical protein
MLDPRIIATGVNRLAEPEDARFAEAASAAAGV